MISIFPRCLFAALSFLVPLAAGAAEPAILAKARSFLGSETTLQAVTSIHFVGTLVTADPADPAKPTRAQVDIIFQRPYRQRITINYEKTVEETALEGYDAWQRLQDATDKTKQRLMLLSPEQIKRLRANTVENLSFYRGLENHGVTIEDLGSATIDGVACQKVKFSHYSGSIAFARYFNLATGQLLLTETESGGEIREQGEIRVDGLRFPKTLVTTTKSATGLPQTVTITFEKITVNENFPADFFSIPSIPTR